MCALNLQIQAWFKLGRHFIEIVCPVGLYVLILNWIQLGKSVTLLPAYISKGLINISFLLMYIVDLV